MLGLFFLAFLGFFIPLCQVFPEKLAFPYYLLGQSQENAEKVVEQLK